MYVDLYLWKIDFLQDAVPGQVVVETTEVLATNHFEDRQWILREENTGVGSFCFGWCGLRRGTVAS